MKKKLITLSALAFAASLAGTALADHPARRVKTESEATALAKHWLHDAKFVGLSVGEVKNLRLIYAVDMLDADEPEQRANHLIIRKEDGFTALIYPAHDAPKLSREHRLGLEGMAGMAGMVGMSGAAQSKTDRQVTTDVEARRHLDGWLKTNGLTDLFAPEDVVSMNGVFIVDLVDRKTRAFVNQAIVRGADAYVALVRPLKASPRLPTLSSIGK